jgi:hypothetical protein
MKIQEERKVVRLKKPILACAVLLGAALGLQATPIQPCSTYTNYAELEATDLTGGCTIGGLTFSDFTYSDSSVNAVGVPVDQLKIANIYSSPSQTGFLFGVALTASGSSSVNDIGLGYNVTGSDITDAAVTMNGFAVGAGSTASIAETICLDHAIAGCSSSVPLYTINIVGGLQKMSDSASFGPVGTIGVLKDVDVVSLGGGFSTISQFSDTVSYGGGGGSVPEPGFYGVLAGGMGAILMFARRRKKTA